MTDTILIRVRRATLAAWTADNPIIPDGQQIFVTDTRQIYLGDGTSRFLDLEPAGIMGPTGADGAIGPMGLTGPPGAAGASAYITAVANGFNGTEAEWLASLVGPQGPSGGGSSAYDVAVANGFVGTEAEWLASLVGPAGPGGGAAYQGFRYTLNGGSDVTVGAGVTHVPLYADQDHDTIPGGYDPLTGLFTVPAELDGAIMEFWSGARGSSAWAGGAIYIQSPNWPVSGGGAAFRNHTQNAIHTGNATGAQTTATGPLKVYAGVQFRSAWWAPQQEIIKAEPRTFFAGKVVG